jgi:hypothetical protein
MIFVAGFNAGFTVVPLVALALLVVAFAGLLRAAHAMLYGESSIAPARATGRTPPPVAPADAGAWMVPVLLALALLVVTGVAWPPGLAAALDLMATVVGH